MRAVQSHKPDRHLGFDIGVMVTGFRSRSGSRGGERHIASMCGRVIQSSGPIRSAIVDGLNVRDSRAHNYPPRWNAAPSQDLLVIRRNHKTGEVTLEPLRWGLIPHWCQDPQGGRKPINAKCETVHTLPSFRDAYRARRCILRHWRTLGELEGAIIRRMDSHLRGHYDRGQRTRCPNPRPNAPDPRARRLPRPT
jgi:hypothetical protein